MRPRFGPRLAHAVVDASVRWSARMVSPCASTGTCLAGASSSSSSGPVPLAAERACSPAIDRSLVVVLASHPRRHRSGPDPHEDAVRVPWRAHRGGDVRAHGGWGLTSGTGGFPGFGSGICGPGEGATPFETRSGTLGTAAEVQLELDCGSLNVATTKGAAGSSRAPMTTGTVRASRPTTKRSRCAPTRTDRNSSWARVTISMCACRRPRGSTWRSTSTPVSSTSTSRAPVSTSSTWS